MKTLRIRKSLPIIGISLVCLYFSGRFLIDYFGLLNSKEDDFSIVIADEDKRFSHNPNYVKAASAYNNKGYRAAIDELNEEIDKHPDHAQAYFLLGKIYEEATFPEGKYFSRMISNYEKYIELRPKGKRIEYAKLKAAQYHVQVGLTQQKVESLDKAEGYLKSLDQTSSEVKMALGAIYLDKQNYDKAIAAFEKSIDLAPSELQLKYNSLGLAYLKKGLYGNAENILEIAVKIDPKDKYARNNLGVAYVRGSKFKAAAIHFTKALELDPAYKNARNNLIWVEKQIRESPTK